MGTGGPTGRLELHPMDYLSVEEYGTGVIKVYSLPISSYFGGRNRHT